MLSLTAKFFFFFFFFEVMLKISQLKKKKKKKKKYCTELSLCSYKRRPQRSERHVCQLDKKLSKVVTEKEGSRDPRFT